MDNRFISLTIAVFLIFASFSACAKAEKPPTATELLNLGEKYLIELNYEQAVVCFERLIEIEPMNPRGYMGAAKAYAGMNQIDKAIEVLEKGLETIGSEPEIQSMIDDLRGAGEDIAEEEPLPSPELDFDEKEIYSQFMSSRQWAEEPWNEDNSVDPDLEITSYKIFDFDENGIDELWIEAYDDTARRRGASAFYTIEDGQVKRLLCGYLSGGSMGGDWIATRYDTETGKHLIGLEGFAGGFGGSAGWGSYYKYENGQLDSVVNLFSISQVESNFSDAELANDALHYVEEYNPFGGTDSQSRYITVYEIDDVQVAKEEYDQISARLESPVDKRFIIEND